MRLIIITLLLLFAGTAHAGEDIELTIKIPLKRGFFDFDKPEIRLGKSDVQIRYQPDAPNRYMLELGDVEWNHKYPSTLFHRDDHLDIDWSRMYNIKDND